MMLWWIVRKNSGDGRVDIDMEEVGSIETPDSEHYMVCYAPLTSLLCLTLTDNNPSQQKTGSDLDSGAQYHCQSSPRQRRWPPGDEDEGQSRDLHLRRD